MEAAGVGQQRVKETGSCTLQPGGGRKAKEGMYRSTCGPGTTLIWVYPLVSPVSGLICSQFSTRKPESERLNEKHPKSHSWVAGLSWTHPQAADSRIVARWHLSPERAGLVWITG